MRLYHENESQSPRYADDPQMWLMWFKSPNVFSRPIWASEFSLHYPLPSLGSVSFHNKSPLHCHSWVSVQFFVPGHKDIESLQRYPLSAGVSWYQSHKVLHTCYMKTCHMAGYSFLPEAKAKQIFPGRQCSLKLVLRERQHSILPAGWVSGQPARGVANNISNSRDRHLFAADASSSRSSLVV